MAIFLLFLLCTAFQQLNDQFSLKAQSHKKLYFTLGYYFSEPLVEENAASSILYFITSFLLT